MYEHNLRYSEFRPHRFAQNVNGFSQKCILVLKAAKSDTERFAALLLVTLLVYSNEMDGHDRRPLFDAIGFNIEHQKCPAQVYKSLALTILACFSSDEELCVHPEMVKKIPLFLEGIS